MIPQSLNQIALPDLHRLVESGIREGRDIEYKKEFPTGQSKEKVHLLRAVTSMANSGGGDVIYGIIAIDGLPVEVCGLTVTETLDEMQLRLENSIRDCVQPRLQGVGFHWVEVAEGKSALVIRVKGSWNAPHRVTLENHNHFYGRNSVGAYPLDVSELRSAFLLSDSVGKRMTDFRTERLMRIEARTVPVPLQDTAVAVLHILPVSAFAASHGQRVAASRELSREFRLIGGNSTCVDINLDGVVGFDERGPLSKEYVQVFRDGCLELAACDPWHADQPQIEGYWLVPGVIGAVQQNIGALAAIGIDGPYVVSLSFVGVSGYKMRVKEYQMRREILIKQSALILPDVLIEDSQFDARSALKPTFDILWNAFGFERCPLFTEDGKLEDES